MTTMITMRIPEKELAQIDAAAQALGISRTKYLTKCAMEAASDIIAEEPKNDEH